MIRYQVVKLIVFNYDIMSDTKQKLHTAKRLYDLRNYVESEKLYRELFLEDSDSFEDFDKIFFLKSINERFIKDNLFTNVLEEQGSFVFENFQQTDCSNRNFIDPYAEIFLNIVKAYNSKNTYYKSIIWAKKLNPDILTNFARFNRRNNKYNYSLREKWYSYFIDSLIGLEKYDAAKDYVNEAMEKLPESKSEAKLWIRYKLAKIEYQLENYEESLDILNNIVKVKKENYVYSNIAKNYYALANYDESLNYALKAILANRSIQNNISTYMLLAELLDKKGYKEESLKHYYLVYTFKKANDNKIPMDLRQLIENQNLDIENKNFKKVLKELRPFWNELKFATMERYGGRIIRVFNDKRIGFIKCDSFPDNLIFDFNDFKEEEYFIIENLAVSFYAIDSYDRKRKRESKRAIEIEVEFDDQ